MSYTLFPLRKARLQRSELAVPGSNPTMIEKAVKSAADYVFLDCPPSLGLITVNALTAADEVIVPLQCETLAHRGVGQLVETVQDVQRATNPRLRISGILPTMFDGRTAHARAVLADIYDRYEIPVLEPPIARSVRFAEDYGVGFGETDELLEQTSRTFFVSSKGLSCNISKSACRLIAASAMHTNVHGCWLAPEGAVPAVATAASNSSHDQLAIGFGPLRSLKRHVVGLTCVHDSASAGWSPSLRKRSTRSPSCTSTKRARPARSRFASAVSGLVASAPAR